MDTLEREERLGQLWQEKKLILRLAALQRNLRSAVQAKIKQEGIDEADIGIKSRVRPYIITEFLRGERIIVGDSLLTALQDFLGSRDTIAEIQQTVQGYMKKRKLALAMYPDDTIVLIFAILEAYIKSSELRTELFASAFGVDQELITGILKTRHEDFGRLADPAVSQRLEDRLTSGQLEERIKAIHKDYLATYFAERAAYEKLIQKALLQHGTLHNIYALLEVHTSKHSLIMQDPPNIRQVSVEDLKEMNSRIVLLLEKSDSKNEDQNKTPRSKANSAKTNNGRNDESGGLLETATNEDKSEREKRSYQQLDGLMQSLRGTLKAIDAFAKYQGVELRGQDKLELARAIAKILRLGAVDMQLLNEAIHGIPTKGQDTIEEIQNLLKMGQGAKTGNK